MSKVLNYQGRRLDPLDLQDEDFQKSWYAVGHHIESRSTLLGTVQRELFGSTALFVYGSAF